MPASKESKKLESSKSTLESTKLDSGVGSNNSTKNSDEKASQSPKAQKLIDSAYDLSLGISIVVAVLLGLGVGVLLQKLSGSVWGLGVGVFWGVGAAVLNIYKAYKRTKRDLEALAHDPKYNYEKPKDS
ncbi:AtpZ/AtpI family protein [Helicobacter sp.]|uniref:AtpZ/AtpI family protein n=1 Tax=Helicobacter sp. TaxID=218 RepID=UPI0025BE84C4|nr:AtpZ/AtpI family protein [Helicobacter sp.]MBR2494776.1 AtpZ/AtpI family protein [Helicobacter sp.]